MFLTIGFCVSKHLAHIIKDRGACEILININSSGYFKESQLLCIIAYIAYTRIFTAYNYVIRIFCKFFDMLY